MNEQVLMQALHDDPADDTTWLVLADWLEEQGQAERAELTRLRVTLRQIDAETEEYHRQEARVQQLIAAGVRPCVPVRTLSIGLDLALIQAGRFVMGSPENETGRWEDESPRHAVRISKAH